MHKNICAVYGEGAVTDRMRQKWFVKFRAGDFSLDDAPGFVELLESLVLSLPQIWKNFSHYFFKYFFFPPLIFEFPLHTY